ncbi:hypothetical protein C6376_17250 [Streptomyces sp. P3]|uniref:hypothetical protein n=1 Tax=Streptomyces sp. P3 TaxID=2135430 RepID=UPI000D1ADD46|nr:hypothetical protein [Streptomyces sp. P3]AVV42903.1 hypothetical protein C6376_17250 [Streptomyces sp. P3]
MISAADTQTVHQLLGRIVYFHALFIEPALQPGPRPEPGPACCNHGSAAHGLRRAVDELLPDSAWAALGDVAATLPDHHRPCPSATGACCATCYIASASAAVAAGWAQAECRGYRRKDATETLLRVCGNAAAVRLGRVFAVQHETPCPTLNGFDEVLAMREALPGPEQLPLTGELLALWADPTVTTRQPVASWLNHCTGLDDVRRALDTRRTGT